MKFKRTKKYQSGGGIPMYQRSPRTPVYTQGMQLMQEGKQQPSPAKTSKSKDSGGNTEWDALPSDIKWRDEGLNRCAQLEAELSDLDIAAGSSKALEYQKCLNTFNSDALKAEFKSNKENYDKFVKENVDKKASAFATSQGKAVAIDKDSGKLVTVSPEEMLSGNFTPLTVNELAEARRNNIALARKDSAFNAIRTSYSREQILDRLQKNIQNLGDYERKTVLEGQEATSSIAAKTGADITKYLIEIKNNAAALKYAKRLNSFLNADQLAQLKIAAIQNGARTQEEIELLQAGMLEAPYELARKDKQSTGIETGGGDGSGSSRSGKTVPLGRKAEYLIGQSLGTISFLDGNLKANTVAARLPYFDTDTKESQRKVQGEDGVLINKIPLVRTWVSQLSKAPTTIDGKPVDMQYMTVDESQEAAFGYLLKTVNGQTLNPFMENKDALQKQFERELNNLVEAKRLQGNNEEISKEADKLAKKIYGQGVIYEPKIFMEVYAGTAKGKNQNIATQPSKFKKELDYDEGLTQAQVLSSFDPTYKEEFEKILFAGSRQDPFYKTVIMADPKEGYLNIARSMSEKLKVPESAVGAEIFSQSSTFSGGVNESSGFLDASTEEFWNN